MQDQLIHVLSIKGFAKEEILAAALGLFLGLLGLSQMFFEKPLFINDATHQAFARAKDRVEPFQLSLRIEQLLNFVSHLPFQLFQFYPVPVDAEPVRIDDWLHVVRDAIYDLIHEVGAIPAPDLTKVLPQIKAQLCKDV